MKGAKLSLPVNDKKRQKNFLCLSFLIFSVHASGGPGWPRYIKEKAAVTRCTCTHTPTQINGSPTIFFRFLSSKWFIYKKQRINTMPVSLFCMWKNKNIILLSHTYFPISTAQSLLLSVNLPSPFHFYLSISMLPSLALALSLSHTHVLSNNVSSYMFVFEYIHSSTWVHCIVLMFANVYNVIYMPPPRPPCPPPPPRHLLLLLKYWKQRAKGNYKETNVLNYLKESRGERDFPYCWRCFSQQPKVVTAAAQQESN